MSLRPDDRKSRGRSKSPGRARERSRSNVRAPSPGPQHHAQSAEHGGPTPQYEVRQPGQPYASPTGNDPITMGNYADLPPHERPGYAQQQAAAQYSGPPGVSYAAPLNVQYSQTSPYGYSAASGGPTRNPSAGGPAFPYAQAPDKITYSAKPVVPQAQTQPPPVRHTPQATAPMSPYQQSGQPPQGYYSAMPQAPPPPPAQHNYPPPPTGKYADHDRDHSQDRERSEHRAEHHRASSSGAPSSYNGHQVVQMVPGGGKINAPPSPSGMRPQGLAVNTGRDGLNPRMDRLSVSGGRPDIQQIVPGGLPPPSPMLEAYHGVYQSLSPMPQAMMMRDDDIDDMYLDSLSPRASSASVNGKHRRTHSSSRRSPSPATPRYKDKLALAAYGGGGREKEREKEKRVKIYDAEDDALAIVDAMAARTPDVEVLIDILPQLSHDQMLELRSEYKRHCKVQGRGINIAKHIKLKISGNFGKICYVTALGKYESEGYWANFWYQSHSARRELLIEALMGRQNHEIRAIKEAFKDKRYGDSLTKCMDKELKADKFRKAILMALEGERQEESDVWSQEHRNRDVDMLYKALRMKEGGESTMLGVVVMRSDAHLREVLRTYERKYQGSFARDALRKSNNLVGEVIAHILNGVINRPARDAMLLHHALMDLIEPSVDGPRNSHGKLASKEATSSKHERQQRYELVISRLTRLHWDRMHMVRVKREYEEKYGRVVEEDLEEATKGDFREFCIALCQTDR